MLLRSDKKVKLVLFLSSAAVLLSALFGLQFIRDSKTTVGENSSPLLTQTVTVGVWSYVSPEKHKCYQYEVFNGSSVPIVGVDVGVNPSTDATELDSLPRGWSIDEMGGGVVHDPNVATMVDAFAAEEQEKFYISTISFRANPTETRGFSVCMPSNWDNSYKSAHWRSYFMNGGSATGQLIDKGSF